ncbi:MAG: PIN domain-containing protein [Pyrinomonadaceae bacterium]|nr:PIN domain-containing protein [Pyrinomonadaceae bacterium]
MRKIFADSVYWIALINPKDQWRRRAFEVSGELDNFSIITTDEILTETLNYFAESGKYFRGIVVREIEKILLNQNVEITDATHENFLDGFELFRSRLNKGYSLTDCISMNIMREYNISDILTHDRHFSQEGFQVLL